MKIYSRDVAILIPCFNEEHRLKKQSFLDYFETHQNWDFYFLDDGSTDKTSAIIKGSLLSENSFLITSLENLGKGNILQESISKLKKNYLFYGFIDADLDIPLSQLDKLYKAIFDSKYLLSISKRPLKSKFSLLDFRSVASLLMMKTANSIIEFNPKIQDTQCGCKLFKREIVNIGFKDPFISEWLFDIELFLRLKAAIIEARSFIIEVDLTNLQKSKDSKLKFKQGFKIGRQLVLINNFYNR
ncbi:glycosyltransferase [Leeuwenhoekiella sp. W20_SRS_FM14]|uniref:glycosyltransferase n=1 Tax=Leeuwenhoekiella sp. W20_SRS_FM14 TaxID=3240270 RepID=UPI003F9D1DE4